MAKSKPKDTAGQDVRVSAVFPDLQGKTAVISGVSKGIGKGIAEFLGRQGMQLILCARTQEAGEAFTAELTAAGVDCRWVTADLSTGRGARKVFNAAVKKYRRVDLLVNNAAILWGRDILDTDEETYRKIFEANCRMVYGISHLVARHMADNGAGSIVNISSVGGLRAHHRHFGYDGSKGAMDSWTRAMAVQLAPYGVRVNAVAPGATLAHPEHGRSVKFTRKQAPYIPLGRVGTREEMAAAVAFLASDAAGYITGQILYVDGGLTVQLTPPGIFV